ncbi:MAG: NAD(+) synthase [Ignavibacteriaceae bacterium]|nr:NAD(+) synthase [Ignavibacteriaceae bacterium]
MNFDRNSILINPKEEVANIVEAIKYSVQTIFKKKGAVIGVSGGVDSSVVLALTARALGNDKVLAVMLPEIESTLDNIDFVGKLLKQVNVDCVTEDLTEALTGLGCYKRRNSAVKELFPEYDGTTYKMKLILPDDILEANNLNIFYLEIISPDGVAKRKRLPLKQYLEIVAASNFKQRTRMSMLYYLAETRNYAVIGTPNKNEHEQGFFVKYGDSGSDFRPIKHLFKTQVYQLADYLDIPVIIKDRVPTSDTYSADQSQEEFFFRLPFDILDRIWYGWENGVSSDQIASALNLSANQVNNVISDIKRKINTTVYLRKEPLDIKSIEIELHSTDH